MNGEHYYYLAGSPTPPAEATKTIVWEQPATLFRCPTPSYDDPLPYSHAPMEVESALGNLGGVALLGDAPAGKYTPGVSYRLKEWWGGLQGDLGVFAPVDLTYEYPETGVIVVHAEQAAQLYPDAPVSLEIELRDAHVVSVAATLATGEMLSFAP